MAILFAMFPFMAFAQTESQTCSANGYKIITINGIFTDKDGAIENRDKLKDLFDDTFNNEPLTVDFLFNPSHLGGVGDVLKSIYQGLFDYETVEDYDLVEMLKDASAKVTTQKLLLVAHSQGNFYANSFYDVVADKAGGVPAESIGVYSVATPSGRVAGGGKWLTSDTDKVIADVVGRVLSRKIMVPNTHIELQNGDDSLGHSFSGIYLKYQRDKIISDIKSSLDSLKTNTVQDKQESCIVPPKLSTAHKIEGAAFAVADPIASAAFAAARITIFTGLDAVELAKEAIIKSVDYVQSNFNAAGQIIQTNVINPLQNAVTQSAGQSQWQLADEGSLLTSDNAVSNSDQSSQSTGNAPGEEVSQAASSNYCDFNAAGSPSHQKIIINEVAWMGGSSGANDEWIELKNNSNSVVDVSGYQIVSQNKKIKIVLESGSKIPANGFYLLERADNTIPDVSADVIYSGVLSNSGDSLQLFDANCGLVDEASASSGWLAGDNDSKKTMERGSDLSWYTSSVIGGTPKKENSAPDLKKKDELIPASTSTQIKITTPTDTPSVGSNICNFNANLTASRQGIIINEIAWMGTANSATDEWIELKNTSGNEINLNGYQLVNQEEKIKVSFTASDKIPVGGFYLLERTDDDTVPNIAADKIYTGALSNTSDGLQLFNSSCGLIDEVLAGSGWTAGDNTSKRTMERKSDFGWQTSANVGGTPKAANSSGYIDIGGAGGGLPPVASAQQQQAASVQSQNSEKILINEIKTSPTSERFIELYNPSEQAVDLTGWYIQRKTQSGGDFGSLVSKTNFEGKTINAKDYFVISRSAMADSDLVIGDITLTDNNTVQLKNQNQEVVDKVGWGNAADFEGTGAAASPSTQSIQRKFDSSANSFIDTDNNAQDFEIRNCSSPGAQFSENCQQAEAPAGLAGVSHIVVSEVYPDKTGDNFDFVELYNPTDSPVGLGDYSLKIIKEEATSTDPLSSFSENQVVNSKSFLLIGFDNYAKSSSTAADIVHASYSLPSTKTATIILYNGNDSIDEFGYDPANLGLGQSFERKAFSGGVCVSAEGDGEFSGNGCDTDSTDDFEIRQVPNPQNSLSFPEPRNAPSAPADFTVEYSSSTSESVFNWQPSQDYSGNSDFLNYIITDISGDTSTLPAVETTSTTAVIPINEAGRDYNFSIQAFDKEGLGSATSTASVSVPDLPADFSIDQEDSNNWINFGHEDWAGNIGVSLQSIFSESYSQFNTVGLEINMQSPEDRAVLKLSVFGSNDSGQPDFNNIINVSYAMNIEGVGIRDLNFYFSNPIILSIGKIYWLALEVYGYTDAGNSYYAFSRNSWQNAISDNNFYLDGEAAKTVVNNYDHSGYNSDISVLPDSDWYMKIGME